MASRSIASLVCNGTVVTDSGIVGTRRVLTGTNSANDTPGQRIQYRFRKTGRYLVICMNRAHSLNDHMFGFVNVVDPEDQQN